MTTPEPKDTDKIVETIMTNGAADQDPKIAFHDGLRALVAVALDAQVQPRFMVGELAMMQLELGNYQIALNREAAEEIAFRAKQAQEAMNAAPDIQPKPTDNNQSN